MERDLEQTILLRDAGWTVLRFWETEIQKDVERCAETLVQVIKRKKCRSIVDQNSYKYADNKGAAEGESLKADLSVGERQIKRVNDMKAKRDQAAADKALGALKEACQGEENLMPYLIDAVKTYATLGEICGVMREVFGEYKQDGSAF